MLKRCYLVLILLIAGCAHNPMIWNKPDLSQSEFKRDNYECIQQSRTSWSGGGFGLVGIAIMIGSKANAQEMAHKLYCACMEARGYSGHEIE